MLVVGCEVAAEAVAACAAVAAEARTRFGFVAVGLFRGRLCGEGADCHAGRKFG